MPYAVTTQGQGADAFISMPSCTINAGTNTGISGIEIDVKPLAGSTAGFINLFGVSSTNVTALRINTATQTLQWRYNSTVYLESAAGSAPLNERHMYGAEWEESTLSLYLTKNGVRIAGPYVAPSAGSLITNIPWNQIGKVGSTAPGGTMAFELYGVRTYGNNCTYQSQWDETGASGAGTAWANDSVDRNLTLTSFAGTSNSWWVFFSNNQIGEGIITAVAVASATINGGKVGQSTASIQSAITAAVQGAKIGQAPMSFALGLSIVLPANKVAVGFIGVVASSALSLQGNKIGFSTVYVTAEASASVYAGDNYIGEGTFAVSAGAAVSLQGSYVGASQVQFQAVAASYIGASKIGANSTSLACNVASQLQASKTGTGTLAVLASATISISGSNSNLATTPVTLLFAQTSSRYSHSVRTSGRYSYNLKTSSGGARV